MERAKLLTVAVIGLFLLNLLTIGYLILKSGKPPHGDRDPADRGPVRVIIERLHFDTQQQQHYRQLIAAHRRQTQELNQQSVQLYRDYYGLLEANPPDTARSNALNQQIGQNQRAVARLNFTHFAQIRALCRPSQRADFARLVGDLSRLFGRPQRADRPGAGGSPGNLPPRP